MGIVFRLFELWPLAIVVANVEVSRVDPGCAQSEENKARKKIISKNSSKILSYQKTAITSIENGMYQSLKTGMTRTKV